MTTIVIFIGLGLLIGYIGGYAGIGGAPFMVAFLVLVLGMSQLSAQGIVLTMMLGPMSLLGLMTLKKEVKEQWKTIIIGVLTYATFSYIGALGAFVLGEVDLRFYFAILLIFVSVLQFLPHSLFVKSEGDVKQTTVPLFWMAVIGIITGTLGGLFGIGAGVLMIPVFMMIFNLGKNHARALSLAILLPPVSIGAFIKYNQEGVIEWKLALILFISYFIANYFGARRGSHAKPVVFKILYGLLLLGISLFYFLA